MVAIIYIKKCIGQGIEDIDVASTMHVKNTTGLLRYACDDNIASGLVEESGKPTDDTSESRTSQSWTYQASPEQKA